MNKRLDIELYEMNQNYCAYIGEIGSSGYECKGSTPKECAEQVKQYIINSFTIDEV